MTILRSIRPPANAKAASAKRGGPRWPRALLSLGMGAQPRLRIGGILAYTVEQRDAPEHISSVRSVVEVSTIGSTVPFKCWRLSTNSLTGPQGSRVPVGAGDCLYAGHDPSTRPLTRRRRSRLPS